MNNNQTGLLAVSEIVYQVELLKQRVAELEKSLAPRMPGRSSAQYDIAPEPVKPSARESVSGLASSGRYFRISDVCRVSGVGKNYAHSILSEMVSSGNVRRVRQGVYVGAK